MRAREFIAEEEVSIENIRNFVVENCQPFIKEIGGIQNITSKVMYRGTNVRSDYTIIVPAYTNRKPANTSAVLHKAFSSAMDQLGIKARRDNSLFVTSVYSDAGLYGREYVVIPIGDFSFSWSNAIDDFYLDIVDHLEKFTDISAKEKQDDVYLDYDDLHDMIETGTVVINEDRLLEFISTYYKTSNLIEAIQVGNEIMIHSEKCFLIREDIFAEVDWIS